ncbi:hypothetical protein MKX01_026547 [Papaver californicum]|nr:hypothetical protein MKX01_026547 [Papaver californicum]
MVVKIYGPVTGACPQRVMACLFEKEIEIEVETKRLELGEHKRPEFLVKQIGLHWLHTKNQMLFFLTKFDYNSLIPFQPFGQVPVVEDGDFRLFGKNLRSIPLTNLLGKTLEERALVDQWLEVEAHNFNELIYAIVFQVVILPRMGQPTDSELVRTSEEKLGKVLDIYEKQLPKNSYLTGDSFSLVDLGHLPGIRCLMNEAGKGYLVKDKKNVNAWWEDISNRPALKKVLKLMENN